MDTEKIQQFLKETEAVAQEIQIVREEMVALDFRRQKTREGFRALKTGVFPKEKAWISLGDVFVKSQTSKAQSIIERDLKATDEEIEELREQLKDKVNKLRDLEGKPELQGFDLKPLTKEAGIILNAFSAK